MLLFCHCLKLQLLLWWLFEKMPGTFSIWSLCARNVIYRSLHNYALLSMGLLTTLYGPEGFQRSVGKHNAYFKTTYIHTYTCHI